MKRQAYHLALALALGVLVFSAEGVYAQNGGSLSMPDWMTVDETSQTVSLEIVAGKTDAFNYWNFNGYANGEATIVVPAGYTVTMTFKNNDPAMAHSVGVGERMDAFPALFTEAVPVFEGAMSSNPTDMMGATQVGASEELTFKADTAGDYALICYIPAHAVTGMWIGFSVSAEAKAGVMTH